MLQLRLIGIDVTTQSLQLRVGLVGLKLLSLIACASSTMQVISHDFSHYSLLTYRGINLFPGE